MNTNDYKNAENFYDLDKVGAVLKAIDATNAMIEKNNNEVLAAEKEYAEKLSACDAEYLEISKLSASVHADIKDVEDRIKETNNRIEQIKEEISEQQLLLAIVTDEEMVNYAKTEIEEKQEELVKKTAELSDLELEYARFGIYKDREQVREMAKELREKKEKIKEEGPHSKESKARIEKFNAVKQERVTMAGKIYYDCLNNVVGKEAFAEIDKKTIERDKAMNALIDAKARKATEDEIRQREIELEYASAELDKAKSDKAISNARNDAVINQIEGSKDFESISINMVQNYKDYLEKKEQYKKMFDPKYDISKEPGFSYKTDEPDLTVADDNTNTNTNDNNNNNGGSAASDAQPSNEDDLDKTFDDINRKLNEVNDAILGAAAVDVAMANDEPAVAVSQAPQAPIAPQAPASDRIFVDEERVTAGKDWMSSNNAVNTNNNTVEVTAVKGEPKRFSIKQFFEAKKDQFEYALMKAKEWVAEKLQGNEIDFEEVGKLL